MRLDSIPPFSQSELFIQIYNVKNYFRTAEVKIKTPAMKLTQKMPLLQEGTRVK